MQQFFLMGSEFMQDKEFRFYVIGVLSGIASWAIMKLLNDYQNERKVLNEKESI